MSYYSCNLNGVCEEDQQSLHFATQAGCQANCRPLGGQEDTREAAYLTMSYNLEQVLEAAPSDRVQVIRRITGATVTPQASWEVLAALVDNNYPFLYTYPFYPYESDNKILRPYVLQRADEFDLLLLDLVRFPPYLQLDWTAVRRRVHWEFLSSFAEHPDSTAAFSLREEPVGSLEELTDVIKYELGSAAQAQLGTREQGMDRRLVIEIVDRHWNRIQATYGERIPYQSLIQPRE